MATNLLNETLYMFPDTILYGSFLMSLTTLSLPHTIFFISILLGLVVLFGLQSGTTFIFGSSVSQMRCKPQIFKYTFDQLFLRTSASNPSYGMYLVSFACTYLATSLYMLKDELDMLDDSTFKQYYISLSTLIAAVFFYLLFRLGYECDSMGASAAGLIFGSVIAIIIVNINVTLYGKDSINFLGIPLLRNTTSDGAPLYICSK